MAKKSEVRSDDAASLQASADSLGASSRMGLPPGAELAEMWKSLANIGVPADALAAAQRDYVSEAAKIWNRLLMPSGEAPVLSDRRFASPDWAGNPASAFLAEMYLLNARYLQELAKSVEADPKTRERIRFTVQQWTTPRRRATSSRSIRKRRRR